MENVVDGSINDELIKVVVDALKYGNLFKLVVASKLVCFRVHNITMFSSG